jgi:hypothetical protein
MSVMLNWLAIGNWGPEQVRAVSAPCTRRVEPEVERTIDEEWDRALCRPGVKLFDGPMCRLESFETSSDRLQLALSPTNYKAFLGTNLTHPEFETQYGSDVMANPVGVSPALICSDGYLLFGLRNASVAYYPNKLHPFAGSLDPRDQLDVFAAVRRELHEELSLTNECLTDIRCTGIAEDLKLRQPELIFMARTSLTSAQVAQRVDADEHRASHALHADGQIVANMLAQKEPSFTPVAFATALLWGRIEFGQDWFDRNSSPFQGEE